MIEENSWPTNIGCPSENRLLKTLWIWGGFKLLMVQKSSDHHLGCVWNHVNNGIPTTNLNCLKFAGFLHHQQLISPWHIHIHIYPSSSPQKNPMNFHQKTHSAGGTNPPHWLSSTALVPRFVTAFARGSQQEQSRRPPASRGLRAINPIGA